MNPLQQQIIEQLIELFKNAGVRPCTSTLKVMTEVVGFMDSGEIKRQVHFMLNGQSTGGGFRYDHPGAYNKFAAEFWRQWDMNN